METGFRYDSVTLSDDTSQIRYRYDAVNLSDDTLEFGHHELFSTKHDSRHALQSKLDIDAVTTIEIRYVIIHTTVECEYVYLCINHLKPKSYFMFRQIRCSTCRQQSAFVCFFYGSQNKEQLFPYTELIELFLQPRRSTFTARYGLHLQILLRLSLACNG